MGQKFQIMVREIKQFCFALNDQRMEGVSPGSFCAYVARGDYVSPEEHKA
jgi:hypothetical protein